MDHRRQTIAKQGAPIVAGLAFFILYSHWRSPFPHFETDSAAMLAAMRLWDHYLLAYPLQRLLTNFTSLFYPDSYALAGHTFTLLMAASCIAFLVRLAIKEKAGASAYGIIAALAFCPLLIWHGLIFEVYILHVFILMAAFSLFHSWELSGKSGFPTGAFLCLGLGLFHHPLIVTAIVPFGFLLIAKRPAKKDAALLALLVCAAVFANWLIFRNQLGQGSVLSQIGRFVAFATGTGQYSSALLALKAVPGNLEILTTTLSDNFTATGAIILLVLAALSTLHKSITARLLLATILCHTAFCLTYDIRDIEDYFLPLLFLTPLASIFALVSIRNRIQNKRVRLVFRGLEISLALLFVLTISSHYFEAKERITFKLIQSENRYYKSLTTLDACAGYNLYSTNELNCNIINYLGATLQEQRWICTRIDKDMLDRTDALKRPACLMEPPQGASFTSRKFHLNYPRQSLRYTTPEHLGRRVTIYFLE